jgi:Deacetylase PdaC
MPNYETPIFRSYRALWMTAGLAFIAVLFCASPDAQGQTAKVFRGSIGGSHVEMHLTFAGNKITGIYAYDRIGEEIKLSGELNAQGGLELAEFGPNRKQTGKIMCKRKLDELSDPECYWSRVDGSHQAFVTLEEQHSGFTGGLRIVPKTIIDRASGVVVSYPQLASDKPLSAASQAFNQRVSAWAKTAVKDFEPEPSQSRMSFELNYNVLLGTNDLVSIEITEYSDSGGAHPNNGFWAMTYDLNKNRELKLEDVFKPDSDYKTAIAKYVIGDINRRANVIEQEDAKREGRKPQTQDEPIVSMDQLTDLSHWASTPNGIMVYFDFPHVISVFDRTFVPYRVVKNYLQPNGPAARFQ